VDRSRRVQSAVAVAFAVAAAHALLTWPVGDAAALFLGVVLIAFPLEALAVRVGLLEHDLSPQIASVPATVLLAWPSAVYVWYRVAALAVPGGVPAAALAALLATAADLIADPVAVRAGLWRYPETPLSEPRFLGVPWWNFAGWPLVVLATASLPAVIGA